ncbi:MAG: hypothetical protein LBT75_02645 [Bacilli bacterium]|jgi:ABC-type polysaccharide/polyol phosphate export permease|nr:hypothetical protein [Bacilli bacterium]
MFEAIKCFVKEHVDNRQYIWKLAVSSAKEETRKTTLGMWWNIIRDIVFFVTYGMFMIVIRGGRNNLIDGMPGLFYLFTGLVAWYLINDSLTQGVRCIIKNKGIFTKIKFPILVIPTIETIALFIKRISTFILLFFLLAFICIFFKFTPKVNIFGLLYSLVSLFIFGVVYNVLMSGFFTISKDFRELYKAIMRVQFYFVPIFWSASHDLVNLGVPHRVITIINNLPFIHLINSFRYSLSLGSFPRLYSIGIFWFIVLIMFVVGAFIQFKLRRIYADFIG